ncbi:ABC transporter ATP-binding protein [Candidatus Contubernalis alkaliaceticus]|uniref:ABC transporter ATP-binding protein n=1 Tax=Candidatus Contubernalis alkaliaceticus TaxID=338645 RepID=UPI001F4BDBFE|nr:ABC transporter ATP-binding protein [Candidatus Contubernalis alkalaceticus]UNC92958.1 ABC transporter ATP-binding protein [Candidatus Contubernalis alkalaceticus]
MISIQMCDLTKVYNEQVIFSGIGEAVEQGNCLVVSGSNGSGKTTLLKIIAGLIRPTSGEIHFKVEGENIPREKQKDCIGYVSPDLMLYEELSALENLYFFAQVRGLLGGLERAEEMLRKVQLEKWKVKMVSTYSTGMKQRLKFAFALLHRPLLLLLDEPGSNLDESGHALVQEIIEEQKRWGCVILSTNDPGEVSRYGDQILQLD